MAMNPLAQQLSEAMGIARRQSSLQRQLLGLTAGLGRGKGGRSGGQGGDQASLRSSNGRINRNRPRASTASTPRQLAALNSP